MAQTPARTPLEQIPRNPSNPGGPAWEIWGTRYESAGWQC
ncbi:hypothetical protein QO003_000878 [Arthrobacter silviterrae]|nr:hypothetical protein [Arthrobacter silviterrae]